jgi:hypothetical protein
MIDTAFIAKVRLEEVADIILGHGWFSLHAMQKERRD